MIVDGTEVEKYLAGKRLALVFFNKDSRNLLRAHAAGTKAFPFTITYLIDPTLVYRPRVRQLAEAILDARRIITDGATLDAVTENGGFDAVMVFEGGYEDQPQDHLLGFSNAAVSSFGELEAKCRADFDNYRKFDPQAEFNARWSQHCVLFLARHFGNQGIWVTSGYNVVLPSIGANDKYVLAFTPHHRMLPTLPDAFAEVPVRFVLGEDWACGKTSYLIEKMREGASGLAGDFWFRLVSPEAIPTFRMSDMFGIKGVIANLIRQASERNPGKPVFIKYDGRLEEFVYGIPRDRTYLIKDMHHYFRDARFAIVHKADTPRMRELVSGFVAKYEVAADRVDRVRVHHDGRIETLAD